MAANTGRILIVDDEPLVLEIFSTVLNEEGYTVDEAGSASDGLSKLEKNSYDVLVCDIRLRPFDGFDIAEIARQRHPELGVILVTGAPVDSDERRAKALSVQYLVKPVGLDQLRDRVRTLYRQVTLKDSEMATSGCGLGLAYPIWALRAR